MAQGLFLESHNVISKRHAILEDDERVAYLYLTRAGTQQPERDVLAYSRINPVDRVEWEASKQTGGAPLLLEELASESAVVEKPAEREFSFKWSPDGTAVALLRDDVPIAFASAAERFGYSKAVVKASPLANNWDQAKYEFTFPK
ncbi:MAG: hypothetical protein U1F48_05635 [Burkholderiales bacterium]